MAESENPEDAENPSLSALKQVLNGSSPFFSASWREIGEEVYSRKLLLLTAARALQGVECKNPLALAATDVFVEKAQKKLGTRAFAYMLSGGIIGLIASALIICAAIAVFDLDISNLFNEKVPRDQISVGLIVFRASSAGAFFAWGIYFLVSMSRALLHEGAVLYKHRHALRFGRLYVYIKNGEVTFDEVEKAFMWNEDFSTAFLHIQPDKMTKTFIARLMDLPSEIIRAIGSKGKEKDSHK